jgi:hypothetical protein
MDGSLAVHFSTGERLAEGIMDAQTLAIVAGILFGGIAIVVACFVWLRKQVFGFGGAALCIAGLLLLSLSIWRSVEVGVSATGITLRAQGIAGDVKPVGNGVTVNDQTVSVPKGPIQIGFWTPSVRTKEASDVSKWEIMDSDAKLDDFANRMVNAGIIEGYRRYEVTGEGRRGARRVGAWWVSTNSAEFNLTEFLNAYIEFWQPGNPSIYMEIQPLRSGGYSNAPR